MFSAKTIVRGSAIRLEKGERKTAGDQKFPGMAAASPTGLTSTPVEMHGVCLKIITYAKAIGQNNKSELSGTLSWVLYFYDTVGTRLPFSRSHYITRHLAEWNALPSHFISQ